MDLEQGDQVRFKPGASLPSGVSLRDILTIACIHRDSGRYYLFDRGDRRGSGGAECDRHNTRWVTTDEKIESTNEKQPTVVNIRNIYSKELIINHND